MKKVLSFALVLAMILGSVSMAFAAKSGYPDTKGIDAEEAINVLTGLGVIEGYEDGTFKPEKSVTRAEMVKMIIAALNMPVKEGVYNTQFVDVAPTAWYSAYVSYGVTLGIIEGKSATIFDPNGVVTYDQAITMTMRALGYTEAALNGVYPACFVSKAVSLGAMKGLHSGSGDANRADCAQLIFNVLQTAIGKVGNNNIWVAFGRGEDGSGAYDSMLVRLGAHLADDDCDNLDENFEYDEAAKGWFTVVTMDLCEADTTLIDLKPLLGHKISYYHNDDCEVVAVAEVKTTEITGKLKAEKLGDVKLVEEGTQPENFFYNGYEVEELPESIDLSKTAFTYTVEMKGSKVENIVSVLVWEVTADKKVKAEDLDDMFDEDKPELLDVAFKVVDEDADEMEINMDSFILEGVDSLEDIEKNHVVYVYAGGYEDDAEPHITKIQVGTKTVTGVYDEVASNGEKVTVEDTTYSIHTQVGVKNGIEAADVNQWAKAGNEGTLYLDCYGKFYTIADVEDAESGYAVVLKTQTANTTESGTETAIDNNRAKIKLFTAEGEAEVLLVNTKNLTVVETVEGEKTTTKYDNADDVNGALEALEPGTVVKVKTDKNDKVTTITLIEMTEYDEEVDDEEGFSINKKGITEGKDEYMIETAVVFSFDAGKDGDNDPSDEDNWSVVKATSLWNKAVDELSTNADEKGKVKVAVVTDAVLNSGDFSYGVIKSYTEIKDYAKVAMLLNGEATTAKWDEDEADTDLLDEPGQVLYKVELNGSEIVSVVAFGSEDDDELVEGKQFITEEITGSAVTVDDHNRMWVKIDGENVWFSLDDEVVVYVYDKSDKAWTVKTASYLDGLKATKYNSIVLYDTNDNDKEYYNVAIVVKE